MRIKPTKTLLLLVMLSPVGCDPSLLNPAFVNSIQGGLFPLVPQPDTNLLLVRVTNSTNDTIRFTVTIERSMPAAQGGSTGTVTQSESIDLFTQPGSQSNEAGVLFECSTANPIPFGAD